MPSRKRLGTMARTRNRITIDDRIEKQKEVVLKAKNRYDSAVEELNKLMTRRDELRSKELMKAISKSDRSYDDILAYINGENPDNADED